MAGDPFAAVREGQAAGEVLTSAARVNLWTEAGLAHRRRMGGNTFDSKLQPLTENEFYVKNETGADRNRFDIVAFEEPIYLRGDNESAFNERTQTYLKAIEPAWPDHFLSWGVLQESCKENKLARVRVGGIAVALVNFADANATTGHRFATIKDATYDYLDSAPCGMARILWRDTTAVSSTRYWCKLWLGGPLPTGMVARTPGGGISACSGSSFPYTPGSGSCDVAKWSGSTYVDAGWNMTVYNTVDASVAGDVLIQIKFDDAGRPLQDVEPC